MFGKEEAGRWCRMASGRVQQCGGLGGSGGGQIPRCHFANIFVYSGSQSGLASRLCCSWPKSRVDQQRSSEAGTRPTASFTLSVGTSLPPQGVQSPDNLKLQFPWCCLPRFALESTHCMNMPATRHVTDQQAITTTERSFLPWDPFDQLLSTFS